MKYLKFKLKYHYNIIRTPDSKQLLKILKYLRAVKKSATLYSNILDHNPLYTNKIIISSKRSPIH